MPRRRKPKQKKFHQKKRGENFIKDILSNPEYAKEEEEKETLNREKLLKKYSKIFNRIKKKKAYITTFKGLKDLYYISFCINHDKANSEATKYFKSLFHPVFLCEEMLYKARSLRIHKLDEYAEEGKVPIADFLRLMQEKIPCKGCGKHLFTYNDYIAKRCFIIEEFDHNPYIKGVLLCRNCFEKYMGN